jgi:hypothetical protein
MRFVDPEVVRIEISGGDWIEIKKALTVRETRKMQFGGMKMKGTAAGEVEFAADMESFGLSKVTTYLVDWSFVDAQGRKVECTPDAVANLDELSYQELEAAIDKHTEAMEKEKKALPETSTGPRLKTISQ